LEKKRGKRKHLVIIDFVGKVSSFYNILAPNISDQKMLAWTPYFFGGFLLMIAGRRKTDVSDLRELTIRMGYQIWAQFVLERIGQHHF
jgi:hypothetical protein